MIENYDENSELLMLAIIDTYHDFMAHTVRTEILIQNSIQRTKIREILAEIIESNPRIINSNIFKACIYHGFIPDLLGYDIDYNIDFVRFINNENYINNVLIQMEAGKHFRRFDINTGYKIDTNKLPLIYTIIGMNFISDDCYEKDKVYNSILNSMNNRYGFSDIHLRHVNYVAQKLHLKDADNYIKKIQKQFYPNAEVNDAYYDENVLTFPVVYIDDTNSTGNGLSPEEYNYRLIESDKKIVDAAITPSIWKSISLSAPFVYFKNQSNIYLLNFHIPDGYGLQIFNQTFTKFENKVRAQCNDTGIYIEISNASVNDIINYILSIDINDEYYRQKILLFLGLKRFGDWIQGLISRDWYFGLQTHDALCACHAILIGAPIVYQDTFYNCTPSEKNKMFWTQNLKAFGIIDENKNEYSIIELAEYNPQFYPYDEYFIQEPLSRIYFNKYKKYKQKYIELKNKLKNKV